MKVETQALDDRQVQLTVEVADDQIRAAMRSAARRLSNKTRIPGFRPGKVPYDIIVKKLGDEAVFEEALETLGQEAYRTALETAEIEAFAPGTLDEVVSREPLILRYTVPLAPEVDLGSYHDLRLDFDEPQVTDEAIEEMLEELRQSQALIEPAARPAQLTDVVILDIRGVLLDPPEGEKADLLDEKGVSVLVAETTDWPVPGISEHLVGVKAGDQKEFTYTFAEADTNESLAGKSARFNLTCQDVKSRFVPAWSDDLARNLGEFEDLLDLRIKVRKTLEDRARQQAEDEYASTVVDEVAKGSEVQFPPALLDQEIHDMLHELDRRLQSQRLTLADYLKIQDKTEEVLREELKPQAEARLRRALVLGKVVEVEDLEVEDPDIDSELDRVISPLKEQGAELRKALDTPAGRRRIALDLLTDKAVKRLTQIARGEAEALPAPVEEGVDTERLEPVSETPVGIPTEASEADIPHEE
ncbi:MAG TPA: trigger factor [Anaerolineales bacterium]|nr:trigger factor [Anaerolineales bacterium]